MSLTISHSPNTEKSPDPFFALLLVVMIVGQVARADSAADWGRMRPITPRGYVCYRAAAALQIDGRVVDEAWQRAPWTGDFVDIEGDRKPKPRFRTRIKMLWDERYFYVGAVLQDPHVWGTLKEHDAVIYQDNDFELFIDPNGDNHEYYEFEINALNTGWDLYLPRPYKDGGRADNGWEIPGLKTAVSVTGTLNDPSDRDTGWSVEIAIPWTAMSKFARRAVPPRDKDQWRMNFSRVQWKHQVVGGGYQKLPKLREDNWVWSPQGIIDMHRPERWGYVQFSTSLARDVPFELDPALPTRDLLMTVYHYQKAFFRQHGRWASNIQDLNIPSEMLAGGSQSLVLEPTDDGFLATVELQLASRAMQRWHVRQDSLIWNSAEQQP